MSVSVHHTYGGNVTVLEPETGARYDMTPDQARVAADQCEDQGRSGPGMKQVIIKILDGLEFAYCGRPEDMTGMAKLLRVCADMAESFTSTRH